MTDVVLGLKRAQLDKSTMGTAIKGMDQAQACPALSKALVEWMKKTKYAFDTCTVVPAGAADFKVTVKLKKNAKETDAEEIRSYITGHSR